MGNCNKNLNNKTGLSSKFLSLPVLIIVYKNTGKEKDKNDNDDKENGHKK